MRATTPYCGKMAPARRVAPKITPAGVARLGRRNATTGATRLVWQNFGQQRGCRAKVQQALALPGLRHGRRRNQTVGKAVIRIGLRVVMADNAIADVRYGHIRIRRRYIEAGWVVQRWVLLRIHIGLRIHTIGQRTACAEQSGCQQADQAQTKAFFHNNSNTAYALMRRPE